METTEIQSYREETIADMFIEILRQEARSDYRRTSLLHSLSFLCIVAGSVLAGLLLMIHVGTPAECLQSPFLFGALGCGAIGLHIAQAQHNRKAKQQRLIEKLSKDTRAVGPLLLLMHPEQEEEVLRAAGTALKDLLPKLRADAALRLNAQQREALCWLLQSRDKDLVFPTLKALEQIGDRRSLAPVEALILTTDKIHVRRAALDCLALLRLRLEEQERAQTLLRPSSAVSLLPEMLLRPARASAEENREQLLRPLD